MTFSLSTQLWRAVFRFRWVCFQSPILALCGQMPVTVGMWWLIIFSGDVFLRLVAHHSWASNFLLEFWECSWPAWWLSHRFPSDHSPAPFHGLQLAPFTLIVMSGFPLGCIFHRRSFPLFLWDKNLHLSWGTGVTNWFHGVHLYLKM